MKDLASKLIAQQTKLGRLKEDRKWLENSKTKLMPDERAILLADYDRRIKRATEAVRLTELELIALSEKVNKKKD